MKKPDPFKHGRYYTRKEISKAVGGSIQWYLPAKQGKILAICLLPKVNPRAPDIVCCGHGVIIAKTGEWLSKQTTGEIPLFIKHAVDHWLFKGYYRVIDSTDKPKIIRQHIDPNLRATDSITRIVWLEQTR